MIVIFNMEVINQENDAIPWLITKLRKHTLVKPCGRVKVMGPNPHLEFQVG